jgi:hypothetical protein
MAGSSLASLLGSSFAVTTTAGETFEADLFAYDEAADVAVFHIRSPHHAQRRLPFCRLLVSLSRPVPLTPLLWRCRARRFNRVVAFHAIVCWRRDVGWCLRARCWCRRPVARLCVVASLGHLFESERGGLNSALSPNFVPASSVAAACALPFACAHQALKHTTLKANLRIVSNSAIEKVEVCDPSLPSSIPPSLGAVRCFFRAGMRVLARSLRCLRPVPLHGRRPNAARVSRSCARCVVTCLHARPLLFSILDRAERPASARHLCHR